LLDLREGLEPDRDASTEFPQPRLGVFQVPDGSVLLTAVNRFSRSY
jgi:hypothetical protein